MFLMVLIIYSNFNTIGFNKWMINVSPRIVRIWNHRTDDFLGVLLTWVLLFPFSFLASLLVVDFVDSLVAGEVLLLVSIKVEKLVRDQQFRRLLPVAYRKTLKSVLFASLAGRKLFVFNDVAFVWFLYRKKVWIN